MATTCHTMLALQAEAFGAHDRKNRGIWLMVRDAFIERDLFRAGWRLACIGNKEARLMFTLTVRLKSELSEEVAP
jgi:hypothetical protein